MQQTISKDSRFPVTNTKLAACLVTLRFLVKKAQPFMTVIEADRPDRRQVTIFLEPSTTSESDHVKYRGTDKVCQKFKACDFENAWNFREEWERRNPLHPFNGMRKAIEAREWIIANFIRNSPPEGTLPLPANQFRTNNFKFACVLKAKQNYLYALDGREFIFEDSVMIREEFDAFNGEPANNDVQWMKLALINYELLNKRIQEPDNVPCVKRERIVRGVRRVLLLPVDCSDSVREQFEELFYANN